MNKIWFIWIRKKNDQILILYKRFLSAKKNSSFWVHLPHPPNTAPFLNTFPSLSSLSFPNTLFPQRSLPQKNKNIFHSKI